VDLLAGLMFYHLIVPGFLGLYSLKENVIIKNNSHSLCLWLCFKLAGVHRHTGAHLQKDSEGVQGAKPPHVERTLLPSPLLA
jgi:hypothetical protein